MLCLLVARADVKKKAEPAAEARRAAVQLAEAVPVREVPKEVVAVLQERERVTQNMEWVKAQLEQLHHKPNIKKRKIDLDQEAVNAARAEQMGKEQQLMFEQAERDQQRAAEQDEQRAAEQDRQQEAQRVEQEAKQSIADKLQADRDREQAELDRQQAERDRERAEQDRLQADQDRKQAELDRQQADKDRERATLERRQAEDSRKQVDRERKRAEQGQQKSKNN
jgi:hypothetical protein